MAELTKLLHFLKSGTEQTAKAYSTTDEAGDNYVNGKIDSVACYIPIGATDDAMATNGRVIKGGTTYAIKSQSKPPYTEVSYTTAGTHTFTVPAGVTRLRVAVCGGGGGSMAICYQDYNVTWSSKAGGTSYFGSTSTIQATGGGGCSATGKVDSEQSYYLGSVSAGSAGSPNGTAGTASYRKYETENGTTYSVNGAAGFALSFTKSSGSYGASGKASVCARSWALVAAVEGGSGGYNTGYIDVTPNTTYTVVVGSAGTKFSKLYTGGYYSNSISDSSSGFVLIAYGGDI